MTQTFASYPQWKAPAEDSAVLIWPDPAELIQSTSENRSLLDSPIKIQGIALSEARHRQRNWLNLDEKRPLMVTAHQTELHHAGVWSKLALLHAAAGKTDADTLFIVVDTDAPKHLNLAWPRVSYPITDDPKLTTAPWTGLLAGPTPGHIQELKNALANDSRSWGFSPAALEFLDQLQRQSLDSPTLSATLSAAMHKLDWDLGLRHAVMGASPIWGSDSYLLLAYHVLARAEKFATIYNQGLKDYRIAHRIRTSARPMPDLQILCNSCEVPYWLDDLASAARSRPHVVRDKQGWRLAIGGDSILLSENTEGWQGAAELKQFLQRHQIRLSPRALTLTLFVRMMIADQFIHGIGGGRYDQVTDQVFRNFFALPAPAFAVTTATLYFPAAVGHVRPCLPCLAHEGHRLRHRVLGERKMELVHQIENLPRKSSQRKQIFSRMQSELAAALTDHPTLLEWQTRAQEANRQILDDAPLFDREYFYAIQPRERLEGIIARYRDAFAGVDPV